MKIITGPRQTGKTTELIKIAHKTYSRILCTSMSHCNSIQEIANKLELNIKPPITIKQFIKNPYKFRKENIAFDEVLYCFFQIFPTFDVTCVTLGYEDNQEFQLLKVNEVPESQQKTYAHTHCSHYVLGECSQEHHNNCVGTKQCIKDLEKQLQRKEQECEKLKIELELITNETDVYKKELSSIYDRKNRYHQALEKIEDLATNGYLKGSRFYEAKELQQILTIINEVKDV